jgi:signal transduction histidine kinase
MSYSIHYQKEAVLQALRMHFIKQSEIKSLMILVNIYAIVTGVLLFMKKIRPEPFLLGSILWIVLMLFFWFGLPNLFYKKTALFKQDWEFKFNSTEAMLLGELGEASWAWETVTHYFESVDFFHFYFGPKSFFLIPKSNLTQEDQHIIRGILKDK